MQRLTPPALWMVATFSKLFKMIQLYGKMDDRAS